jgi:DNA polymerase-3 subunit beta
MKLNVSKDLLVSGLQLVQTIVISRSTVPSLSNVLLRAGNGKLEMTTTDLDLVITCEVDANVESEGAFTVPARLLLGLVKEMPGTSIDIESDDRVYCQVQAGSALYKLKGLGIEEFPTIQSKPSSGWIYVDQELFKRLLKRTSFAVSPDDSRTVLTGVCVSISEKKITMVGTDGKRLSLAEEEADVPSGLKTQFVIPIKTINELLRVPFASGQLEICPENNRVVFVIRCEKGIKETVYSKLLEGPYPNFRQVIPSSIKDKIRINREELAQALRRAQFLTNEKQNSVKLSFSKNLLTVTANSQEAGEAKETIPVNYPGEEISLAFNPTYLLDPLRVLEFDEISLELQDVYSPAVIRVDGPYLYVIMPMRS